jgi:tetratricopeptide (TPR) repeat protein
MRSFAAVLTCALALATASVASGDPQETPAQEQADRLFAEGRALITADKPKQACEKFEQAIKLDPTAAGTMLNLGVCYEQLDKPKTALVWFRRAQIRASESNLPEYEATAKEHARTLVDIVPTVAIELTGAPAQGTHVMLDQDEIAPTDYGRIEVDPGKHVIEVRAPGMQPYHLEIDLPLRKSQTIAVALVAAVAAVSPRFVILDPGKSRRHLGLEIAGAGGVVWLGVLGYGLYERHVNDTASTSKANATIDHLKYYGTGAFCVGAAAIAAGAYLYFTAPDKERVERTAVVPTVSSDGAGFALVGTF